MVVAVLSRMVLSRMSGVTMRPKGSPMGRHLSNGNMG